MDDFIIWSWMLEERIVHVTTTGWVNSHEVTSSLILKHCLFQVFFVLQIGRLFHWLEERGVFDWVVLYKSLDVLLKLVAGLTAVDLLTTHHAVWRNSCSLNAITEV